MTGALVNQNIHKRIRRRRKHFLRKRRFAKIFLDADHAKVAEQLYACQETELLAFCQNCSTRWYVLNRCRTRVCPLCSFEVSLKRARFLKHLTRHMSHPKMLTLTMPLWQTDPQDGIRFLRKSFAALRKTHTFSGVLGGAYQIEVKVKPDGYHIHMHVMLDAPFIPYQRLFTEWKNITHSNAPQIDIRSTNDPKALAYVVKYATKSADFDAHPDTIVAWYDATKGQRLFATFGKWYNVTLEELDPDHPTEPPRLQCPNCKAVHNVFFARDGPFIFGHDMWTNIQDSVCGPDFEVRPLAGANEAVETEWTPEERKEYTCQNNQQSNASNANSQMTMSL